MYKLNGTCSYCEDRTVYRISESSRCHVTLFEISYIDEKNVSVLLICCHAKGILND